MMSYELWLQYVDGWLEKNYGLHHDDLPDCNTRDMYNDGWSPEKAAKHIIANADL